LGNRRHILSRMLCGGTGQKETVVEGETAVRDLLKCQPSNSLFMDKTTDIVSGGAWGRRPHTLGEATLLLSNYELL
jgi:hypothetical protein